ncbi:MAG: hypothetical protein M3Y81_04750 [Chloroflexota bacterium]|nr:hypothetical protein [Chloroflexota bacterium]
MHNAPETNNRTDTAGRGTGKGKGTQAGYARRKILVGAFILERASRDEQYHRWLQKSLEGFLVRADDRVLFGLAPLPGSAAVSAPAPVSSPSSNIGNQEMRF